MKKLLRNSLIASVVAVAGVVSAANNAIAIDSNPIEFSGTVANSCTFGTPTAGILVADSQQGKARLSSITNIGGQHGTIQLSCNGGANIAVKELQEVSTNGMTRNASRSNWFNVLVKGSDGEAMLFENGGKKDYTKADAFSENLTVELQIHYQEATLNPGTYTYRTVITATPQ